MSDRVVCQHITTIVEKPQEESGGIRWHRWECACGRRGTWRLRREDTEAAARLHRLAGDA